MHAWTKKKTVNWVVETPNKLARSPRLCQWLHQMASSFPKMCTLRVGARIPFMTHESANNGAYLSSIISLQKLFTKQDESRGSLPVPLTFFLYERVRQGKISVSSCCMVADHVKFCAVRLKWEVIYHTWSLRQMGRSGCVLEVCWNLEIGVKLDNKKRMRTR